MSQYTKDNPDGIAEMFSSIAPKYDRGNYALSLGLHKRWNQALINSTLREKPPQIYLDLCCGTGEISFTYLKSCHGVTLPPEKTYLLDFSGSMLAQAEKRAKTLGVDIHNLIYLQADAQVIPLPDQSVDAVTMAYGIRNIKDPTMAINEIKRVLKPGGRLGILELTRPQNSLLRAGHKVYLHTLVPLLGRLMTPNADAYRYLKKSIQAFVPPEQIIATLEETGFQEAKQTPLLGGVATLITGVL